MWTQLCYQFAQRHFRRIHTEYHELRVGMFDPAGHASKSFRCSAHHLGCKSRFTSIPLVLRHMSACCKHKETFRKINERIIPREKRKREPDADGDSNLKLLNFLHGPDIAASSNAIAGPSSKREPAADEGSTRKLPKLSHGQDLSGSSNAVAGPSESIPIDLSLLQFTGTAGFRSVDVSNVSSLDPEPSTSDFSHGHFNTEVQGMAISSGASFFAPVEAQQTHFNTESHGMTIPFGVPPFAPAGGFGLDPSGAPFFSETIGNFPNGSFTSNLFSFSSPSEDQPDKSGSTWEWETITGVQHEWGR